MTATITQHIEQTGAAEYTVTISVNGAEPTTQVFTRSNFVFPAFRTLIHALRELSDCDVHVTTNAKPVADEYNGHRNNPHTSLLRQLIDQITRNNISLTVELVTD